MSIFDFLDYKGKYDREHQLTITCQAQCAQLFDAVQALTAERDAQAQHIVNLLAENGDLREQLDKAQTREKAAAEQRKIVQEHLDVLSPKPKRTSRAKPTEKEG